MSCGVLSSAAEIERISRGWQVYLCLHAHTELQQLLNMLADYLGFP